MQYIKGMQFGTRRLTKYASTDNVSPSPSEGALDIPNSVGLRREVSCSQPCFFLWLVSAELPSQAVY